MSLSQTGAFVATAAALAGGAWALSTAVAPTDPVAGQDTFDSIEGLLGSGVEIAALLLVVRLPELATAGSSGAAAGMLLAMVAVAWAFYWVLLRVLSAAAGDEPA